MQLKIVDKLYKYTRIVPPIQNIICNMLYILQNALFSLGEKYEVFVLYLTIENKCAIPIHSCV